SEGHGRPKPRGGRPARVRRVMVVTSQTRPESTVLPTKAIERATVFGGFFRAHRLLPPPRGYVARTSVESGKRFKQSTISDLGSSSGFRTRSERAVVPVPLTRNPSQRISGSVGISPRSLKGMNSSLLVGIGGAKKASSSSFFTNPAFHSLKSSFFSGTFTSALGTNTSSTRSLIWSFGKSLSSGNTRRSFPSIFGKSASFAFGGPSSPGGWSFMCFSKKLKIATRKSGR